MTRYEYKVVPAPRRGVKAKGLKTTEDRFAHAMALTMNEYGAEGWEYIRADVLPCEEREGLIGRATVFQNLLVFRRPLDASPAQDEVREHVAAALAPATAEEPLPTVQSGAEETPLPVTPPAEPERAADPAPQPADPAPAEPAVADTADGDTPRP